MLCFLFQPLDHIATLKSYGQEREGSREFTSFFVTIMPQSHPPMNPVRFLSPVQFFAHKAEWSAHRIFTSVRFSWSHQATSCIWLDMAVHLWFGTGIVRTPQGNLQCFSYPTGPVRGPCRTRTGDVRHPCGHVRELIQTKLTKIPHGHRIWPYGDRKGPARAV